MDVSDRLLCLAIACSCSRPHIDIRSSHSGISAVGGRHSMSILLLLLFLRARAPAARAPPWITMPHVQRPAVQGTSRSHVDVHAVRAPDDVKYSAVSVDCGRERVGQKWVGWDIGVGPAGDLNWGGTGHPRRPLHCHLLCDTHRPLNLYGTHLTSRTGIHFGPCRVGVVGS